MQTLLRTSLIIIFLLGSKGLLAESETPESVYNHYLDSVLKANSLDELFVFWTINHINEVNEEIRRAARIGRNAGEDKKAALKQMKARATITDRNSVSKEITGGRSKLNYNATSKEKNESYNIVVDMLFEDGQWKIIRERMLHK
ncbi:hypothetical protein DFR30_2597 [Thiogranum longum]|uniref:Lumazine-binding protein n=1 Tax=Thiogranum longum TaxID=1537524 RepID=A0A4R1HBF0_9GAMM|nr:hypothetical protein [Thiogranum longum]TCK19287.1 hypothetical protein DFR30_2597 [Thiogranum longum]